jgi:protein-ribulosamine 3-kinase
MMLGEFTAISTIYEKMPHFVPAPLGWGKYVTSPIDGVDTYFFIEDFLDMEISIPEPLQFTSKVAEMHQTITSPNGMFGFPVVTCDGKVPHTVDWEKSWAVFFTNLLRGVLRIDTEVNGVWPEMEAAANQLFSAVIPRLLGVLQSDGREIKASLIHGDLWGGNIGTLVETGEIVLFDAGSYYAHNEMDTAMWRCGRHQYIRSRVYTRNYMRNFEPAEPTEEWDDRNRLYSLKYNLNYAIGHPGNVARDM